MFDEYIQYGGFPIIGISSFDTRSAYQIVEGIYASVITRDISKRHKIRNKELFDRVVRYIIENVGMTFSAPSIVKFMKSENRSLSVESVYNYIKWLSEAFIIYPCQRYDLQGKAVLKTQEKYYLSDISFRYSQMGFDRKMLSAMLENVVYLAWFSISPFTFDFSYSIIIKAKEWNAIRDGCNYRMHIIANISFGISY